MLILRIAALSAAVTAVYAQTCAPAQIQPAARNLDFADGKPGDHPPGWEPSSPECFVPPHVYRTAIVAGAACRSGKRCGVLRAADHESDESRGGLFQLIDASGYRGKIVTLRAAVRAEVARGSDARLLLRIHRKDGSTSYRDDLGKFPITSRAWGTYEIEAPVDADARDIEFGLMLEGSGAAWIDHVSLTFTDAHTHP